MKNVMENVELVEFMTWGTEVTTKHYKSDLSYDLKRIATSVVGDKFIWVSRKCGTHLWSAENIFLDGHQNSTSADYWLEEKSVKAFLLTVTDIESGIVGSVAELNPSALKKYLNENLVKTNVTVFNMNGSVETVLYEPENSKKWTPLSSIEKLEFSPVSDIDSDLAVKNIEKKCSMNTKKIVLFRCYELESKNPDQVVYKSGNTIVKGSWDDDGFFHLYLWTFKNGKWNEGDGCCLEVSPDLSDDEISFTSVFNDGLNLLEVSDLVKEKFLTRVVEIASDPSLD